MRSSIFWIVGAVAAMACASSPAVAQRPAPAATMVIAVSESPLPSKARAAIMRTKGSAGSDVIVIAPGARQSEALGGALAMLTQIRGAERVPSATRVTYVDAVSVPARTRVPKAIEAQLNAQVKAAKAGKARVIKPFGRVKAITTK